MNNEKRSPLPSGDLLKLRRWNTPTVHNGWEQITLHDPCGRTNREDVQDFMPQMGSMVGYAVTVVCEPGNPAHLKSQPDAWNEYRRYVASVPGPKIVVVKDLEGPNFVAAFLGEVNASFHRGVGCVGAIADAAVRDVDDMTNVGFKVLAKTLRVGHGYGWPVRWNVPVDVFGCTVQPGELIHADKHGFFVVPQEDEAGLLDATLFMDNNECDNLIPPGRNGAGKQPEQIVQEMAAGVERFGGMAKQKFHGNGQPNGHLHR